MLPDDNDEGISAGPAEPPGQWPRAVREPLDEFLNMLAVVKRDTDAIFKDFPMEWPSKNALIALAKRLRKLFDMTERYQKIGKGGRKKILEDFSDATIGAAIAAKLLTREELSIDRIKEIFKHVRQFQRKLEALLRTSRSTST